MVLEAPGSTLTTLTGTTGSMPVVIAVHVAPTVSAAPVHFQRCAGASLPSVAEVSELPIQTVPAVESLGSNATVEVARYSLAPMATARADSYQLAPLSVVT